MWNSAEDAFAKAKELLIHADKTKYSEIKELLEAAATGGVTEAKYYLYSFDYTNAKNSEEKANSIALCKEAADVGIAAAQYDLGLHYLYGDGLPNDSACAVSYFEKAAGQGYREALRILVRLFTSGTKVTKDLNRAAFWKNWDGVSAYYEKPDDENSNVGTNPANSGQTASEENTSQNNNAIERVLPEYHIDGMEAMDFDVPNVGKRRAYGANGVAEYICFIPEDFAIDITKIDSGSDVTLSFDEDEYAVINKKNMDIIGSTSECLIRTINRMVELEYIPSFPDQIMGFGLSVENGILSMTAAGQMNFFEE